MLNKQFKVIFSSLAVANLFWQLPMLGQDLNPPGASGGLGQSDWQTPDNSNQYQNNANQSQVQTEWQNAANAATAGQNNWQTPGLEQNGQNTEQSSWQNPANNNGQGQSFNNATQNINSPRQANSLGQSDWQTPGLSQNNNNNNLGQSSWQQPQSAFQANTNQSNNQSDYYYGQANQGGQPNPGQSQNANNAANQNNWQTIPPSQQGQVQKSHGGLVRAISGVTQTALTGARIMAPVAGMYMYGKALSSSPYGMMGMGMPYGMMGGMGMPYGGMGGMGGYGGGYGMPYAPGMGGMSSFMHY